LRPKCEILDLEYGNRSEVRYQLKRDWKCGEMSEEEKKAFITPIP